MESAPLRFGPFHGLVEHLTQDPRTAGFWRVAAWPIALVLSARLSAIRRSADVRVEGAGAHYEGAAVYVHWHRHVPFLIAHHGAHRRWMLMGRAPYLQPMTLWCQLQGLRTLPVGREGRESLLSALARGESVTMAIDGPRGPAFKPKEGCIELAREARVPIIPVGYTSERGHTATRRWDKSLVPSLFDRITVSYGAPLVIDDSTSTAELLNRVCDGLNRLSRSDEPIT